MHTLLKNVRWGETLIVLTGALLLFNVWYIAQTGDFAYWVAAKALYAVALLLFLVDR